MQLLQVSQRLCELLRLEQHDRQTLASFLVVRVQLDGPTVARDGKVRGALVVEVELTL